ncbi:adenylate kinase family protein [Plantactinospora solaniradicis]|uniref:Adenylate kinase n=1 Tax=Plantactinospora solaniradicis TaxID=1723736 RepID=A0ABW1K5G3_9ACTN
MRLIVLGPPGSDRQDVAAGVATRLGVPTINLAELVQAEIRAHSPAAQQAVRHMKAGELVPDRLLLAMVRDRLTRSDVAGGFVLDGFPSYKVPAVWLDALLADLGTAVDWAIDLVLTDTEVLRRLSGRRVCRGCHRIWHTGSAPTRRPDVCDRCGGELFRRHDDDPEAITVNLESYRSAVGRTLDHYRSLGRLLSIDGTPSTAEIVAEVQAGDRNGAPT